MGNSPSYGACRMVMLEGGIADDEGRANATNGGGYAEAHSGGTSIAIGSGSRAYSYNGGRAVATNGGHAIAR